ncbi:MAG: NUDIX hydrolase [Planctomycetota bacterium]|nr:NUDIX hydrolase [Planctomycetota bacterium]
MAAERPPVDSEDRDGDFRAAHLRGQDFVGAFAVVERQGRILMVENLRRIAGRTVPTWDLPGGQVEPGERLLEALARELDEETGLLVTGDPKLLFVQEGERVVAGRRDHVWRSHFFAAETRGEPAAGSEVQAVRWFARHELDAALVAPYHDSFRQWLATGGEFFASRWSD